MNKLLIILILAIAGVTDIMGQSGTVTLYINNGIFNGAEFIMPCSKEKYLVRATMDSDTPAWYNGQKKQEQCCIFSIQPLKLTTYRQFKE